MSADGSVEQQVGEETSLIGGFLLTEQINLSRSVGSASAEDSFGFNTTQNGNVHFSDVKNKMFVLMQFDQVDPLYGGLCRTSQTCVAFRFCLQQGNELVT